MEKLVIIDGNAIVHRAFHALPPMNTQDGQLTNAVYGFFAMLLKLLNDLKPEYLIVCFDRPKPTFRKQMYVGYQAKRPKMSDDLAPQIDLLHRVLEKSKIEHFEIDGYEADDIIGTIATQSAAENLQAIIVSGDRDMLQLVNHKVLVLAPISGITKMALFDEEKVKEKYGLNPAQFIDYKALVGDSSDNYPGVSGIGPKTASDLLNKYHTFENLYEHISELPENIGVKLATDAEQAALAKKLATIITDAPVKMNLEKAKVGVIDRIGLLEAFKDLGFKSLMGRVLGNNVLIQEKDKKLSKAKSASGGKKEISDQLNLL
jgi:DNA polymerase-1